MDGTMSDKIWKSADGRTMTISEMDDRHLRNSIAMIYRGYAADGRRVSQETRELLGDLIQEQDRRKALDCEMKKARKEEYMAEVKADKKKYDYVDVRFAGNPDRLYTYKIRKGAKAHLGQKLVVENEHGNKIVFVVGLNTGRTGNVEIKEKVVKL